VGHASGIKIAAWAKAEQRKKNREQNRGGVRNIFGFLFCVAVLVFVFSDHSSLQKFIDSKIQPKLIHALARNENSSTLRQNALRHENELDEISK
jgi:hypothetical protein